MSVRVPLNPALKAKVVTLLKSGLYGRHQGDVIERLACERIRQLQGTSILPTKKKADEPQRV